MMSVAEYAADISKSVDDIISMCKTLGIAANTGNDLLDDDAIIMLDNAMAEGEISQDAEILEDIEQDEAVEELLETADINIDIEDTVKTEKVVNKNVKRDTNRKNIAALKKDMYKNKEKLVSNKAKTDEKVVLFTEGMNIKDLSEAMGVPTSEVMKKLLNLGIMATVNTSIDFDNAEILVLDFGKELKRVETSDVTDFESLEIVEDEKDLEPRPPVVTIMGHVDHGKTSLLDAIRESSVVEGEAGGITQHISAYQVEKDGKLVTFIDTPGHAAFTEMRARGASVTDIVIIIVAADDGVKPQTKEAIDHAKAAGVPIIVAINKIDKPNANIEKTTQTVADAGLMPEAWGGDTIFANVSAKTGEGLDELLENILLLSEVNEFKANPNRYAMGSVIEAKLEKKIGSVVTLLVQNGTLRLGDPIVIGTTLGKVRTLKKTNGEEIVEALPGAPVEVTGFTETPKAGDKFMAFETEKEAKQVANQRKTKEKLNSNQGAAPVTLDDLFANIQAGNKEINVIVKTDVHGSEEAIKKSLLDIDVEGARLKVIRSGVGTITESDVVLASASNAIIIGFNVRPVNTTLDLAKEHGVDVRVYNIIYQIIEEMEQAMKGVLDPIYEEKVLGTAEVLQLFKFSKVGVIAGCKVITGVIKTTAKARVIRDNIVLYDGDIASIQREKDQVKEIKKGFECGITIKDYDDIQENDVIEAYELVEIKR